MAGPPKPRGQPALRPARDGGPDELVVRAVAGPVQDLISGLDGLPQAAPQVPDVRLHHRQGHLPVPPRLAVVPLQIAAGVPNIDVMGLEHEAPVGPLGFVGRHLVDLSVVQLQGDEAPVGGVVDHPPVGQDRGGPGVRAELVDLDAADLVGPAVHLLHEDVVADESVDEDALGDLGGRTLPPHVGHEIGQGVVRLGENVVVEEDQEDGEDHARGHRRPDDPEQVHAGGLHRDDLVVLGEPAESGHAGDEDGAGEGQGHHVA